MKSRQTSTFTDLKLATKNVIDRGIHDKNDTFSFIYNELRNHPGNFIPPENPGDKGVKAGKNSINGGFIE
jgi:hypothetical protein